MDFADSFHSDQGDSVYSFEPHWLLEGHIFDKVALINRFCSFCGQLSFPGWVGEVHVFVLCWTRAGVCAGHGLVSVVGPGIQGLTTVCSTALPTTVLWMHSLGPLPAHHHPVMQTGPFQ